MPSKLKANDPWTCHLCFTKVMGPIARAKHIKERHPELSPGWMNAGNKGNRNWKRLGQFRTFLPPRED